MAWIKKVDYYKFSVLSMYKKKLVLIIKKNREKLLKSAKQYYENNKEKLRKQARNKLSNKEKA